MAPDFGPAGSSAGQRTPPERDSVDLRQLGWVLDIGGRCGLAQVGPINLTATGADLIPPAPPRSHRHTGDIPASEGDSDYPWIEFRVGNGMLVLWGGGGAVGADTPLVYVDDLDAHLQHTKDAGATIVTPIVEHRYRASTAEDCEGRHWQFMQAGPRIGR